MGGVGVGWDVWEKQGQVVFAKGRRGGRGQGRRGGGGGPGAEGGRRAPPPTSR